MLYAKINNDIKKYFLFPYKFICCSNFGTITASTTNVLFLKKILRNILDIKKTPTRAPLPYSDSECIYLCIDVIVCGSMDVIEQGVVT